MKSSVVNAVLMCHAPIVIPEIAGRHESDIALTTQSMKDIAKEVVSSKPDLVVVLSPHTTRFKNSFGYIDGGVLSGDFSDFGFENLSVQFDNAVEIIESITANTEKEGVLLESLGRTTLDHGAMVPLWFLQEAGWSKKTIVISFPMKTSHELNKKFGIALSKTAKDRNENWMILASGDMSHRLKEGAPSGYEPNAKKFDQWVVEHVQAGNFDKAISVNNDLRELAAEDVIDSLEVATSAIENNTGFAFKSYQGPFGVGYLNAILHLEKNINPLLKLSRTSIETALHKKKYQPSMNEINEAQYYDDTQGVFITLFKKTPEGEELRGCIGRFEREYDKLADDIAECAVESAFSDPRFPPLKENELKDLRIEISLLDKPEKIESESELDPHQYGVLIKSGNRRATLLPNIEGIDTVRDQLSIVRRKAGIGENEAIEMFRYKIKKIEE